ncbi:7-cyano-7-deazaguanine synthase [hydrothermal vent metagenome]|uniref:7-cyano-7-deazaguanine synthase n=1 Tax=hydrothermal vent metagenome TaxID=652676 RepID=A0A3B0WGJ0_9ZZZZ
MPANKLPKAIVLLSGGLDSATVLAIASQKYDCHALSFDYAQRSLSEINAAQQIAGIFSASFQLIYIDKGVMAGSALTDDDIAVPEVLSEVLGDAGSGTVEIPVTYVPARNTLFLSHALAVAEVMSAQDIFIGVNAVDYSGYPDCRPAFISAYEKMANLATKAGVEGKRLSIHTPLIDKSKADIIRSGHKLGLDYAVTVSCYQANAQGEACGNCDSCQLRLKGFEDVGVPDPTRYF